MFGFKLSTITTASLGPIVKVPPTGMNNIDEFFNLSINSESKVCPRSPRCTNVNPLTVTL